MKTTFLLVVAIAHSTVIVAGEPARSTLQLVTSDYPNTEAFGGTVDRNADWYKQCLRVKSVQAPKTDHSPEQATSSLEGCNAEDLYYDVRNKANPKKLDWAKARNCAIATNDDAVLMMLYANGFGVARNLKVAMRYACALGGAPAEVEGRVMHLAGMIEGDTDDAIFDLCDDITSGLMQGHCTAIAERQSAKARNARLTRITRNMAQSLRPTFGKLQKAQSEFAKRRGNKETDLSGTARAAMAIEAEAAELDQFVDDLQRLENGNALQSVPDQFAEMDKRLNRIYQRLMRAKSEEDQRLGYSTVTKPDIRETQKAWLRYRDAWVSFAKAKNPSSDPRTLKTLLTERRVKQLEELYEFADEK